MASMRQPGLAAAALAGDPIARMALHDEAEERGDPTTPYVVGQCYLVQLTTLYYVGRVAAQGLGWLKLADASWVHWTGRLGTLLVRGFAEEGWPQGHRRPRTERCPRPVILHVGTQGAAAHEWPHPLPQGSIER